MSPLAWCTEDTMKKTTISLLAIVILGVLLARPLQAQALQDNLSFLAPLVGGAWEGQMRLPPDGKKTATVSLRFELMWDGAAVKYARSVPDLKFAQEGYVYWDADAKKACLFALDSRGDARTGDVALFEGQVTVTGRMAMQGKTFDYKNTFAIGSDGKLTDRWFQNALGTWQPGHVIEFGRHD
jgi:hypothetical protein